MTCPVKPDNRELESPGHCDNCHEFAWLHPTEVDDWRCDVCDPVVDDETLQKRCVHGVPDNEVCGYCCGYAEQGNKS